VVYQESIPAALTKDKKRVHGEEAAVHLAWQSTLYVTNFPEGTDDPAIRNLFGTVWSSLSLHSQPNIC
jgi:squamous cell carcinoma antigen recognized by T-cells 3